jgi:hypothetical protein
VRPIPGKQSDGEMEAAHQHIREQAEAAAKVLFKDKKTCGECHFYKGKADQIVPDRIEPTNVPTIWLPHAKFSHIAHRAVQCESCHEGANGSTTSADVLLPGIETCVQCHAPPTRQRGGARFECTECHRYHHGDTPLRGIGTEQRDPAVRRTIAEVLSD